MSTLSRIPATFSITRKRGDLSLTAAMSRRRIPSQCQVISTGSRRATGNLYTVTLPDGGLLVHDVGVFTFAPDGSILEDRGPKMLFYGDTEKLCSVLN